MASAGLLLPRRLLDNMAGLTENQYPVSAARVISLPLGLTTLNSRPRFSVLRIDGGWKIEMDPAAPDDAELMVDRIDAFAFALEEEFGRGRFDDGSGEPETASECNRRRKWPAYDDENGCSW